MTLTISTTHTTTEERQIELPAYFKNAAGTEFIAALTETEFHRVSYWRDLPEIAPRMGRVAQIQARAEIRDMKPCPREEFVQAMDEAFAIICATSSQFI